MAALRTTNCAVAVWTVDWTSVAGQRLRPSVECVKEELGLVGRREMYTMRYYRVGSVFRSDSVNPT